MLNQGYEDKVLESAKFFAWCQELESEVKIIHQTIGYI